jgi:hypothetical protein
MLDRISHIGMYTYSHINCLILIISLLSRNLNNMSNIIRTSTAFNDTFWEELRFWCHNLAEFCTACKKWKFWYRPLLLFGSQNELKKWPLRFLFYVVIQRFYSIAWHWLIHTRNHSVIHLFIPSFILSYNRSVASFRATSPQIAI